MLTGIRNVMSYPLGFETLRCVIERLATNLR